MNNRLTLTEIAGALAESTGRNSKALERFLTEFISVVRDYTFADGTVQIKGLGSFKIIRVEESESIDADTAKERMVVPEHYQLTFVPDKELQEKVNSPFSFFESVEVGKDAVLPIAKEEEEKAGYATKEKAIVTEQLINKNMETYDEENKERPSSDTLIKVLGAAVAVLIIAIGILLYAAKDCLFSSSNKIENATVNNRERSVKPPVPQALPEEEVAAEEDVVKEEEAEVKTPKPPQQLTVRVKRGDRLNLFALKYYGNKLFWVYIYEHNKAKLDNPDIIPIGITLVIPPASQYGINANNPASVRKAAVLQTKILERYQLPDYTPWYRRSY
ncbi:MAG: HU family DNA-binding protein [Bacteroidales bacterium]